MLISNDVGFSFLYISYYNRGHFFFIKQARDFSNIISVRFFHFLQYTRTHAHTNTHTHSTDDDSTEKSAENLPKTAAQLHSAFKQTINTVAKMVLAAISSACFKYGFDTSTQYANIHQKEEKQWKKELLQKLNVESFHDGIDVIIGTQLLYPMACICIAFTQVLVLTPFRTFLAVLPFLFIGAQMSNESNEQRVWCIISFISYVLYLNMGGNEWE